MHGTLAVPCKIGPLKPWIRPFQKRLSADTVFLSKNPGPGSDLIYNQLQRHHRMGSNRSVYSESEGERLWRGLAGGTTLELLPAHLEPQLALDSQSVATVKLSPIYQLCEQSLRYCDEFIATFRFGDRRIARTGSEEVESARSPRRTRDRTTSHTDDPFRRLVL